MLQLFLRGYTLEHFELRELWLSGTLRRPFTLLYLSLIDIMIVHWPHPWLLFRSMQRPELRYRSLWFM